MQWTIKLFRQLYFQVIAGIFLGILFGAISPELATSMKPFADFFIKLIKMIVTPIIFLTLVIGITSMKDMKSVGKTGGQALIYFLITTTCALGIGLIVANLFKPGSAVNIDPNSLNLKAAESYLGHSEHFTSLSDFILNIIPTTFFSAFTQGDILQVLFVSIIFSFALMSYGSNNQSILTGINDLSKVFFKIIHGIMHYAPIAAFAAMAYTVGTYGLHTLVDLLGLLICFYLTCLVFILGILGSILYWYCGINIFQLIRYLKTEIFIVIATSSSESVLPNLLEKLTELGCGPSIVDLVLPTGYSFNLDGTAIYLSLAALFIAQATNSDLSLSQQLFLLLVMIISSKGAAGVTGSGFVVLASSLATVGTVPVAGVVLILGIDRFMSEGRALTNMIGNAVATIIISKWQNSIDLPRMKAILNNNYSQETLEAAKCL